MSPAAFSLLALVEGRHPALSPDAVWAGVVVIVIGFLFLAAAVIGPIVRALSPQDLPGGHGGSSGHH